MDVHHASPASPSKNSDGPTSATRALNVGVIGLGVGEQHLIAYERHPACSVRVLCDRSAAQREAVGSRHRGIDLVADADAVLRDPSIDVVSIATWDDAHGEQVITALDHGKHVFVEKPLCTRADEAKRIREALAGRPDLHLSSNLILRRSPRMRAVRRMIAEGDLGRLFHVEGAYDYGRLHKLTDGWRGRIPGYSVTLGGAVHLIDLLLWLTGDRVVEVAAFGNGIASRGSLFEGHDMMAAALRFASGMTGTVTANFGCVRPHGHGLTICGSGATFVNDAPHGRLYTSRDPEVAPRKVTEAHPGAAKGDLIAAFVDAILGAGDPPVSADDLFHCLSICLAIDRSRLLGGMVSVE